jgi:hypothetical protein
MDRPISHMLEKFNIIDTARQFQVEKNPSRAGDSSADNLPPHYVNDTLIPFRIVYE